MNSRPYQKALFKLRNFQKQALRKPFTMTYLASKMGGSRGGVTERQTAMLYPVCRHVMTSGKTCEAPALKGGHFCYYHNRLHSDAKKTVTPMDSIEIPVIEDYCTLQLVLAQVLKQMVNGNIDRHRAGLLLYGLQIAAQTVDRSHVPVPSMAVKSISRTREGDDLAPEKTGCQGSDYCENCPMAETCENYNPEDTLDTDDDED